MHAEASTSKRRPISPHVLIDVYEELERRSPQARHRADRMAFLMCIPREAVLDAAHAVGASIEEDNPALPTDMAIAIVRKVYKLD